MRKHFAIGAAALALSATSVLAEDWSGFYAGIGIGNLEVDTSVPGIKENDTAYGIHAGYRMDAGDWVVGGEFEHDWTNLDLVPGAISVDRVMRLKATLGYDLGPALVYLAAGTANVDVDGLGDDWGGFYGIGAAYAVSDRANVSLELLEHNFNDIGGSGIDADAWSAGLRASWRF
ncbi:outer membrane beta-barrel protein [Paracoccus fistulariae]|uniref:Porin family protein n=1 Tax=Paracoccus fistulariae TaxID=658446 RepID=A0ABY7SHB7_9RHOB|nr:porin [Paracoccus fistulariae]MDB6181757.1 outer membrane beta-barrel protein [Paracoccus fistulariae]WCR05948.1 porin family protein [Paracoccus fistulariae]